MIAGLLKHLRSLAAGRILMYVAGALGVAVVAFVAKIWIERNHLRLDAVRCETQILALTMDNEQKRQQINSTITALQHLTEEIEVREGAIQSVQQERDSARQAAEVAQSRAASVRGALYAGDCENWADRPVCPGIVDQWIQERSEVIQRMEKTQ